MRVRVSQGTAALRDAALSEPAVTPMMRPRPVSWRWMNLSHDIIERVRKPMFNFMTRTLVQRSMDWTIRCCFPEVKTANSYDTPSFTTDMRCALSHQYTPLLDDPRFETTSRQCCDTRTNHCNHVRCSCSLQLAGPFWDLMTYKRSCAIKASSPGDATPCLGPSNSTYRISIYTRFYATDLPTPAQ